MSISLVRDVLDSEGIPPTQRLVLLVLAYHADENGMCFPSIATIARKTGLCERAVRNNIRAAETDGILSTDRAGGRSGVNVYRLSLTPAPDAARHDMPPAPYAPPPGIWFHLPRHQMPPISH